MGVHGFNIGESGLIFIGVGIGTSIGAYMTIPLSKHYPKLIAKWRGFPPPEERLLGAMIGAPTLVVGCFWLGWTGQYHSVHWIVPAIATVPIGFSIALVFNSFLVSCVAPSDVGWFADCIPTGIPHRHVPAVQRVGFFREHDL